MLGTLKWLSAVFLLLSRAAFAGGKGAEPEPTCPLATSYGCSACDHCEETDTYYSDYSWAEESDLCGVMKYKCYKVCTEEEKCEPVCEYAYKNVCHPVCKTEKKCGEPTCETVENEVCKPVCETVYNEVCKPECYTPDPVCKPVCEKKCTPGPCHKVPNCHHGKGKGKGKGRRLLREEPATQRRRLAGSESSYDSSYSSSAASYAESHAYAAAEEEPADDYKPDDYEPKHDYEEPEEDYEEPEPEYEEPEEPEYEEKDYGCTYEEVCEPEVCEDVCEEVCDDPEEVCEDKCEKVPEEVCDTKCEIVEEEKCTPGECVEQEVCEQNCYAKKYQKCEDKCETVPSCEVKCEEEEKHCYCMYS